ncbi:ABC transporter permease [Emticicia soli]|uniref:ABC transporter permease n=1 Tax=Emticicia soli TaxID=2027878 RepID=A0ABW5JAK5_9BACT
MKHFNRSVPKQEKPLDETEPPKLAQRLLEWYCRTAILEDLQGDLYEYFERNLKSKGPTYAKFIYWIDVLKFFRLYTVREPSFTNLYIYIIMISSYLKTFRRGLVRNKLFSFINIFGLAVSISVGLLVVAFVLDLRSYDDSQLKKDRIYRVISEHTSSNQTKMELASTSVKAGKRIKETISGIEDITIMRQGFYGDAQVGENYLPLNATWADESFFKVFSFPLLKGDPASALKEPFSLVLTEKSAKKLFGDVEALGKIVKFDTVSYVVTGIAKDVSKLSHIRFDALVSFSSVEATSKNDEYFYDWGSIWSNYVYLTLPPNTESDKLQANLSRLSVQENKALTDNVKIMLNLQPLKDIAIGQNLSNSIGPHVSPVVLWILGGLALVIILSACFNYMNLSIARSLRRAREVGIRKIIGAPFGHIFGQFMTESIFTALLSLIFSFFLFLFLRQQFLDLDPHLSDLVSLNLSFKLIAYFILLAIGVGIVAGFFPALFFSRINALQVVKDNAKFKVFRHINIRKALIVVQYSLSLIFIATTLIGFRQYKGMLSFDLGFKTDNILNIRMQGQSADLLIKELVEIPAVQATSKSLMITSLGSMHGNQLKYINPKDGSKDSAMIWMNMVDKNYLPLHQHKFAAGSNFNANPKAGEESEAIVNEQTLKRFNIAKQNPQKALGEQVIVDNKKLTIVGVLKDFHYGTLEHKIEPVIFRYSDDPKASNVNVLIKSTDIPATMASIENAWRKIDKVHPIDAKFYNDQLEKTYAQFSVMVKGIGFISFLAICIASLGLFGMVVFTAEVRLKEIGIRKVLGATESGLIFLLSKGFLLLLGVAALVALPATYLFFDQIILPKLVYHLPMAFYEFVVPVLAVMLLASLLIGSQALKAARTNPVKNLKIE